ncbi:MAG: precorrin-6y C5,15-methyltransferase (decarboxylating) subunit CbiE [Desulfoarculaceae bacterium]|nr:precorrin-6y C5,15-methyltransferase (decarboxylating) subunit CbiE [Desulfoarculaceae bacterium]
MKQTMVHLVGVESSDPFSDKTISLIRNAVAVVLSRRHRARIDSILDALPALSIIPITPVQVALAQAALQLKRGDVVVLATGDPLFFGIGRTLLHFFDPDRILIYPALSSMQIAFSRFKIPWDDARFLSLHGREINNLASSLLTHDKVFLFTDQRNSPDLIAQSLLTECGQEINSLSMVHVAENLGMEDEQLLSGTLAEIAEQTFGPLTVMILIKTQRSLAEPCFGLSEDEIIHSRGLITKNEVRAASLHGLRLPRQGVLWDLGAGSGSIGLEAARLFPGLQVFAVERQDEQVENIQKNRKQFLAWNLQIVHGSAPEALAGLPAPDRVFIGGNGGQLQAIIEQAAARLSPGGRIVVNAVLEKTAQDAPRFLHENGLKVSLSEIQVVRRCYPQAMDGPVSQGPWTDQERPEKDSQTMYPITIIIGQKAKIIDASVPLEPWTAKERQKNGQEKSDE